MKILATHRLVSGVEPGGFLAAAAGDFDVREIASLDALKAAWARCV